MSSGFDLATVGDNCIDRFLPPIGLSLVGGNAVNVGVQLAHLGHRVGYFGAIGDDADGWRTRDCLAANGLDLAGLRVVPGGRTAYTDIAIHDGGEREMVFEEFGVCRGYRPSEAEIAILAAKRHVHIGWLDDGGAMKRRLTGMGVSVSQDLGVNADPRDISPDHLAIAFASAGPSREAAAALVDRCLAAGARLAVVTMGALGSCAGDGRTMAWMAPARADVVDTTGAGDSFVAGFLDAHLRGATLEACLAAGRDRAARTCTHWGGFPQEPQRLA